MRVSMRAPLSRILTTSAGRMISSFTGVSRSTSGLFKATTPLHNKWSDRIRNWGKLSGSEPKEQTELSDPYNISPIESRRQDALAQWNLVNQPQQDLIVQHNQTIDSICCAVQEYKWVIFSRSDSKRMQALCNEIKLILDYYETFIDSVLYKNIRQNLASVIRSMDISSKLAQSGITIIESEVYELEHQINQEKCPINKAASKQCLLMKQESLAILRKYKAVIETLPPEMQNAELVVDNFCKTVEANKRVLTQAYNTVRLACSIQDALKCKELLDNIIGCTGDIQKSWENLGTITAILSQSIQHQVSRELGSKTQQSNKSD